MLQLKTPHDILDEIAARAKERRLELRLTQVGLAVRANVSLGSLKRFESTGQIAFESLIKLAFALDSLSTFEKLFVSECTPLTIVDLLKQQRPKAKRGRIS